MESLFHASIVGRLRSWRDAFATGRQRSALVLFRVWCAGCSVQQHGGVEWQQRWSLLWRVGAAGFRDEVVVGDLGFVAGG